MTSRTRLEERIAAGKLLVAPGVYDALTAKLAEGAGFEAVYTTGYGTSGSCCRHSSNSTSSWGHLAMLRSRRDTGSIDERDS